MCFLMDLTFCILFAFGQVNALKRLHVHGLDISLLIGGSVAVVPSCPRYISTKKDSSPTYAMFCASMYVCMLLFRMNTLFHESHLVPVNKAPKGP